MQKNFARAAHFFVHFLAVVLHDLNVKLLLASYLPVLLEEMLASLFTLFFSLPLIFT